MTTAALVTDLETAIRQATGAVIGAARARANVLLRLAGPVRGLLPPTAQRGSAGRRLSTSEQAVNQLLAGLTQPRDAAGAIGAARRALALVNQFMRSIEAALTAATDGLADRIAVASGVFAGMGTDLPVTGAQRNDLTTLDDRLREPGGLAAAVPDPVAAVDLAGRGVLALMALERAARDAIAPGPLTDRGRAALALATAARRLPVTSDGHDDRRKALVSAIRTVRPATGVLSRLQWPDSAEAARESGERVSAVTAQVAELESVTRQVVAAATTELDGLRPEAEAAQVVAGAVRGLLRHVGDHEAGLGTRLDQAVEGLRAASPSWWPATGTELATVARLDAAAAELTGAAERVRQAISGVGDAVADVLAVTGEVGQNRVGAVTAQIGMVRELLPYTGGQRAGLTADLDEAVARVDRSGPQPGEVTLESVEAAARDFFWLPGAEADVRQVFRRAISGLTERLDAAGALARAARVLLPQTGNGQDALADALTAAEQAVLASRPRRMAPAGPGLRGLLRPRPQVVRAATGQATRIAPVSAEEQLRATIRLEAASRAVLEAVSIELNRRRQHLDAARERAFAARVLLRHGGPGQTEPDRPPGRGGRAAA